MAALDRIDPVSFKRDKRKDPHWDGDQWHDGAQRGLEADNSWLWLRREGPHWWAFAGDAGSAELRHDGAWWIEEQGLWFVVHEGQAWARTLFQGWYARGLIPASPETKMIYSGDFERVAVLTSSGAMVFDARTGAELLRIPETPIPQHLKIPKELALPPESFFAG